MGHRLKLNFLTVPNVWPRSSSRTVKNDIALIKIDANNLDPVKMGNSDNVDLGEWVVGIGNPYGIGQSIMIGIVRARKRG